MIKPREVPQPKCSACGGSGVIYSVGGLRLGRCSCVKGVGQ